MRGVFVLRSSLALLLVFTTLTHPSAGKCQEVNPKYELILLSGDIAKGETVDVASTGIIIGRGSARSELSRRSWILKDGRATFLDKGFRARKVNSLGEVVGFSPKKRIFLRSVDGKITTYAFPEGFAYTTIRGITDDGLIYISAFNIKGVQVKDTAEFFRRPSSKKWLRLQTSTVSTEAGYALWSRDPVIPGTAKQYILRSPGERIQIGSAAELGLAPSRIASNGVVAGRRKVLVRVSRTRSQNVLRLVVRGTAGDVTTADGIDPLRNMELVDVNASKVMVGYSTRTKTTGTRLSKAPLVSSPTEGTKNLIELVGGLPSDVAGAKRVILTGIDDQGLIAGYFEITDATTNATISRPFIIKPKK